MPSDEDIRTLIELLTANRRTLAQLLKQRALISELLAPPSINNGIREARTEIHRIKDALRSWGVAVEDIPTDDETPAERLNVSTTTQQSQQNRTLIIGLVSAIILLSIVGVTGFLLLINNRLNTNAHTEVTPTQTPLEAEMKALINSEVKATIAQDWGTLRDIYYDDALIIDRRCDDSIPRQIWKGWREIYQRATSKSTRDFMDNLKSFEHRNVSVTINSDGNVEVTYKGFIADHQSYVDNGRFTVSKINGKWMIISLEYGIPPCVMP